MKDAASWCIVLTNFGYVAPAWYAVRRRLWYKAWVFTSMLWASFFYHLYDTELWPRNGHRWFNRTQLLDFFISYQLFVMMALVSLGPEDELKPVSAKTKAWLWPQRLFSLLIIGCFMFRGRNAHLDNAVNIPMAFILVATWTLHHHIFLGNRGPASNERLQLAANGILTVCGLAIYIYIQEVVGPYWLWHSIWHLLCSLGSMRILLNKTSAWAAADDFEAKHD
eukprot:TRINITY_DN31952_c0_g1_i1.p1 TRINITY_DN31952_c0_g1~~TRINITY_DN31952_c0_g1_i1.p1  ORF type:complete len:223 (-),score=14.94 TRINITY_DN31952_c0_g1_i1:67-735(-)